MSETKAPPPTGPNMIAELKVSGHLMTLDTGIFCVFNAPGSPMPDAQTGLPGVRVSLPPGPASRPDVISIQTFRDDGWISGWNGAALVRVLRGPAQILVTIHQAPNSKVEAPKLQVVKLIDGAHLPAVPAPAGSRVVVQRGEAAPPAAPANAASAMPAPARAAAAAAPAADLSDREVIAHVQGRGDLGVALGETMGRAGSNQWIEGFSIAPQGTLGPADIEYQAVLGRGWLSPWAEGGQFCGSRGMSLPILGLRVRLRGEAAEHYDCAIEASFTDGSKIGPVDNGDPVQAPSLAPLESFRVIITARAAAAPAKVASKAEAPKPKAAPAKAAPAKPAAKPAPAKAAMPAAKPKKK